MKARIKRMVINSQMLSTIMETDTVWRVMSGTPPGSTFRGITLDPLTMMIHLFLEHPSFDEVEIDKDVAPTLKTLFKKIQ